VENKPKSSLVVPLGKALYGMLLTLSKGVSRKISRGEATEKIRLKSITKLPSTLSVSCNPGGKRPPLTRASAEKFPGRPTEKRPKNSKKGEKYHY